jgi:hypothetical protein
LVRIFASFFERRLEKVAEADNGWDGGASVNFTSGGRPIKASDEIVY